MSTITRTLRNLRRVGVKVRHAPRDPRLQLLTRI